MCVQLGLDRSSPLGWVPMSPNLGLAPGRGCSAQPHSNSTMMKVCSAITCEYGERVPKDWRQREAGRRDRERQHMVNGGGHTAALFPMPQPTW